MRIFLPVSGVSFLLGFGYAIWTTYVEMVTQQSWMVGHITTHRSCSSCSPSSSSWWAWSRSRFPRNVLMVAGNLRSTRTALLAIVGLAIVLRLAFALGYWTDQPLTRDEREYLSLSRGLTAGHGFVYDDVAREGGVDPFGRAPGYPAFLALIGAGREVTTSVPAIAQIAQSLIGGVGVWLVFVLARRLAVIALGSWPHSARRVIRR